MIVDCHTHWGRPWQNRYGCDPTAWLETLDGHNVTHAIVLPEKGLFHAGRIQDDHEEIAEVCSKSDGRMIPFCTAHTVFREEAVHQVHEALWNMGFRGVKFHPWVQGLSVSAPIMDEICDIAAEYGAPILFHDGTPPFSLPSQIALLAQRHPRTQIILGHTGLFEHWREAVAAMQMTPNLWACLCSPYPAAMRYVIQHCELDRILWGTDFGFKLEDCIGYRLEMMDLLGLTSEQRDTILVHNPARLLNVPDPKT